MRKAPKVFIRVNVASKNNGALDAAPNCGRCCDSTLQRIMIVLDTMCASAYPIVSGPCVARISEIRRRPAWSRQAAQQSTSGHSRLRQAVSAACRRRSRAAALFSFSRCKSAWPRISSARASPSSTTTTYPRQHPCGQGYLDIRGVRTAVKAALTGLYLFTRKGTNDEPGRIRRRCPSALSNPPSTW